MVDEPDNYLGFRVQDEEELQELAELIVEEVESMGHSAAIASDGAEALKYLATQRPQVILSDINMPNMNGCTFRQEIVENFSHLKDVPFIFVSAYAEQDDIADAMEVGADHFVTKPIDFDSLRELVQNLIDGQHQTDNWNQF